MRLLALQNKMYTQFIHKTKQQCKEEPLDGGSGPTMMADVQPASPDAQRSLPEAVEGGVARARKLRQWRDRPPLTYVRRPALSPAKMQRPTALQQSAACLWD